MGFRKGSYATVWETKQPENARYMDARISTSRKDKMTDQYSTDFNAYVRLIGNAATKGASLQPNDRIKIGDCEVTNRYDKEKKITYTNYAIFDFEKVDSKYSNNQSNSSGDGMSADDFMNIADGVDDKLPFD